eukprot:GHVR01092186.1.p1 GENE.GHVR01092186.1~~GHVR01092186.1.p1  ORF type:complete len:256 (-),score=46.09 GHVR01092186.1:104-871(-)
MLISSHIHKKKKIKKKVKKSKVKMSLDDPKELDSTNTGIQECHLFPGNFGIAVQLALACLTVTVLVCKRQLEDPRRPWETFLYDSSKQIVGQGWAHILNIFIAFIFEVATIKGDACEWYWINIVVDTTFGTVVTYGLLLLSMRWLGYKTGIYEEEGHGHMYVYGRQLGIWVVIVSIMKFVCVVFMGFFGKLLLNLAHAFLKPVEDHDKLKLVCVMIITPIIMNVLQLVITDTFLKAKQVYHNNNNEEEVPLANES